MKDVFNTVIFIMKEEKRNEKENFYTAALSFLVAALRQLLAP